MRIIVSFEHREADAFEVRALAMAMVRHPRLTDQDYEAGIVDYHSQPQQRRMKAGDVIHAAKRAYADRKETRAIESGHVDGAVPRPSNYTQMRAQFAGLIREFRARGIDPTSEDLLREHARRVQDR